MLLRRQGREPNPTACVPRRHSSRFIRRQQGAERSQHHPYTRQFFPFQQGRRNQQSFAGRIRSAADAEIRPMNLECLADGAGNGVQRSMGDQMRRHAPSAFGWQNAARPPPLRDGREIAAPPQRPNRKNRSCAVRPWRWPGLPPHSPTMVCSSACLSKAAGSGSTRAGPGWRRSCGQGFQVRPDYRIRCYFAANRAVPRERLVAKCLQGPNPFAFPLLRSSCTEFAVKRPRRGKAGRSYCNHPKLSTGDRAIPAHPLCPFRHFGP